MQFILYKDSSSARKLVSVSKSGQYIEKNHYGPLSHFAIKNIIVLSLLCQEKKTLNNLTSNKL